MDYSTVNGSSSDLSVEEESPPTDNKGAGDGNVVNGHRNGSPDSFCDIPGRPSEYNCNHLYCLA